MPKDGCNNMEKNKILRYHKAGEEPEAIARHLRLTERIVKNIIDYHSKPEPEAKPEKKAKKKAKKKSAKDDFDD